MVTWQSFSFAKGIFFTLSKPTLDLKQLSDEWLEHICKLQIFLQNVGTYLEAN
jgi:hypothetical protein